MAGWAFVIVMHSDIYRTVNRIVVCAAAAFACIFAIVYFRGAVVCPSRVLYGESFILCGCTRDFFGVLKGDLNMRNPLSLGLFCVLGAEFAWRLVFSFARVRRTVARTDAILHLAVAVPLLVYLAAVNPLLREALRI